MIPLLEEIYNTGVVHDASGNEHTLHSHVERPEGELLSRVITADPDVRKTLEIGCAFGLSSLHICSALSGRDAAHHVIIDPFQQKHWHGIGIANLRRAGFDFFEHIEEPSEFALPALAREQSGTFDMVLIDGWHTFDHTLLDFFYANRLIRVGGHILVDDCNMPAVNRAIDYILKYPAYQLVSTVGRADKERSFKKTIGMIVKTLIPLSIAGYCIPRNLYDRFYVRLTYPTMVAFKKVKEDDRRWDWYEPF